MAKYKRDPAAYMELLAELRPSNKAPKAKKGKKIEKKPTAPAKGHKKIAKKKTASKKKK